MRPSEIRRLAFAGADPGDRRTAIDGAQGEDASKIRCGGCGAGNHRTSPFCWLCYTRLTGFVAGAGGMSLYVRAKLGGA